MIHKLSVKFQPFSGVAVLKSVELPQCISGHEPQAVSPLFYQYFLVKEGTAESREVNQIDCTSKGTTLRNAGAFFFFYVL